MKKNFAYYSVWSCLLIAIALTALTFHYDVAVSEQNTAPKTLLVDGRISEPLWIETGQGRFEFTAEIADTGEERAKGLMFRETMPSKHGMLFDFGEKRRIQMWMRNTPLSLDMIFLDEQGTVRKIAERTTPFSDTIIDSDEPVTHVLEINAGVSRLIGLKTGDSIHHRLFEK